MCGIVGIAGNGPADHAPRMRAMRDRLVHRGPDSEGEHVDACAALGVRRLRIIDLATGDQPMASEDGRVWTVFNGEIYNFRGLRDELSARGHAFHTTSDTEVIPHLYEEHGPAFVERLVGMFALAVWDESEQVLVLARDRLGKKPLLYRTCDGEIAFASEHAALLAGLTDVPPVYPQAIRLYLRFGYVPAPHDAFQGFRKLLPGHYLLWRHGRTSVHRYWRLPDDQVEMHEEEAVGEFRRLFKQSVERRLISDVPLGALLSGGIDSSAVVATMAGLTSRVRTFSIGFEDAEFSELPHARRVAQLFGTEHHEFVVTPDAMEVVPDLVHHYGEPYADASALPTYYLTKMTRQHVTVALDGDGGDELFAGYERYDAVRLAAVLDRIPRPLRIAVAAGTRVLPDSLSARSRVRRFRRFLAATPLDPGPRYLRWLGIFDEDTLTDLLDPDFARAAPTNGEVPGLAVSFDDGDPVRAAQMIDLLLYLPDDLLVKMDIASMANSLEVRCPFLDHELVEFAWRLPTDLKVRGTERKRLLKRAFDGVLPPENMYRRKQGFGVPVGAWMRGMLAEQVEELVLSPTALARGYFRPDRLRALVRSHTRGQEDHTARLWALLMLELWHRAFRVA